MKAVLIIDDERTDSSLLGYLITKRSAVRTEIHYCATVEEAMKELQHNQAGVIFLNLELPGAVDFLMESRRQGVPAVATISQLPELILAVRLLGVDYLFRPFDPEQVSEYLCTDKWNRSLNQALTA